MTSLLPAPRRTAPAVDRTDAAHRRPLVALAALAGIAAAGATLLPSLAGGVVGWFLTDAGAHGAPRDGLRVGAVGWLTAHGSGVHIDGTSVTAVPLALSLLAAVVVWRVGLRLGDSVSGHGPDADAIADGVRDWTVASATGVFVLGYAAVAVLTHHLAATPATSPSLARTLLWVVVLCVVVGGGAVAVGSGRAAIWSSFLPLSLRAAVVAARRIVAWYAVAAAVVLGVSLVLSWNDAVNVMAQLHTSPGAAVLLVGVCVLLTPNATLFSGSYLLGPGFAVGAHTMVTPTAVVLGPLPMFPLLAALPGTGPTSGLASALLAIPPLVAAVAVHHTMRRYPTARWDDAALRGVGAGLLAATGFAVLAALSGGAVGPGRMADVGPFVFQVLLHGVATFGIGGLVGSLLATARHRRSPAASPPTP
ncbi:MAG TPA: DUF6350 family protein [Nocardioides sp.]|jgi:hypothetical protein|uniref:cell division protein PerM n=1 Tax=Nocardioides sp. TaxID=35761 RepID=UPI002E35A93E|nr:DUF6350 family protein [Nocardioides sp.]HEX3932517.1 DUF6350 family protein [Nocardioides sp.]